MRSNILFAYHLSRIYKYSVYFQNYLMYLFSCKQREKPLKCLFLSIFRQACLEVCWFEFHLSRVRYAIRSTTWQVLDCVVFSLWSFIVFRLVASFSFFLCVWCLHHSVVFPSYRCVSPWRHILFYIFDGNPNYRFKMNPRYLAQFEALFIFVKLLSKRHGCSTKAQHNFNTVIAGKRFSLKESLSVLEF